MNANGGNDTLTDGSGSDRFIYQTTSDRTFTGDIIIIPPLPLSFKLITLLTQIRLACQREILIKR